MLNKEICKKCIGADWFVFDDWDWDNGNFLCPDIGWLQIKEEPPKKCHFYLEYILEKGKQCIK